MNIKDVNKRGEAAIIGTVLLVLAVVVSGGIVAYYTVQQAQSVDASCLEVLNGIEFVDVGYSCRMPDAPEGALTSFSVRITDDRIEGFQIGFEQEGDTQTYEVKSGSSYDQLCILGSDFAEPLSPPVSGDTRTYVTRGDVQKMFIAPILKGGKGCYAEARKDTTIPNECVNPAVESEMVACLNLPGTTCGDGTVDLGEECDDGTVDPDDTYRDDPLVGDDDGACVIDEQRPSASCEDNACGDGYRNDASEECDDGNIIADDGCSSTCQLETCTITNLRWNTPLSVYEGSTSSLLADVMTCGGETFSFAVKEDDLPLGVGGTDSAASTQPTSLVVGQGSSSISRDWIAEWASDILSGETNPPEYYFELTHDSSVSRSPVDVPNELKVRACGDVIIDSADGEACDTTSLGGYTCLTVPGGSFTGGTLACYPRGHVAECEFDINACVGAGPVCGDGLIEAPETCDDGDTDNYDGCSSTCQIESGWVCNGQPSVCSQCGNGEIDPGEECDGTNFGGASCTTFGRPGGALACTSSCTVDLAGCSLCGDGFQGPGETCDPPGSSCGVIEGGDTGDADGSDGGVTGNAIGDGSGQGGSQGVCSPTCTACEQPPAPVLGSPTWSVTSAIEGEPVGYTITGTNVATLPLETEIWEDDPFFDDLIQTISTTFDFAGSPVIVHDVPAPWQCDIFLGILCEWFEGVQSELYVKARITGQPSTEVISSNVLFTTEGNPTCGNGLLQFDESCDPPEGVCSPDYGSSCTYCNGACNVGFVQGGYCGDGIPNGPETCDGSTQMCTTTGGYLGTQTCNGGCSGYDTCSSSLFCGDGVRNGPETCDGSDLNGQSCSSFGFTGGTLSCQSGCGGFDTSQCTTGGQTCGNGIVEGTETCDPPFSQQSCGGVVGGVTGSVTGSGSIGSGSAQQDIPVGGGTQTCDAECHWGSCVANP